MNIKLFAILCCSVIWLHTTGQNWVYFLEDGDLDPKELRATSDGGCLAICSNNTGSGPLDGKVKKLDQNGQVQWTTTLDGTTNGTQFSEMDLGPANVSVYMGKTLVNDELNIQKLDASGVWQWTVFISGVTGSERALDVKFDPMGNIYAAFYANGNIRLRKMDPDGNTLWEQTVDWDFNTFLDITLALDELDNVVLAANDGFSTTPQAAFRFFDASGSVFFDVKDELFISNWAASIAFLGDQRFVFSGYSLNQSTTTLAYLFPNGTIDYVDLQSYPDFFNNGNDEILDIRPSGNGEFTALLQFFSSSITQMFKVDSIGNYMWGASAALPSRLFNVEPGAGETAFVSANISLNPVVFKIDSSGSLPISPLWGKIFRNPETQCVPTLPNDTIGLQNWIVFLTGNGDTLTSVTDELGNYSFNAPQGVYQLGLVRPNRSWFTCGGPTNFTLTFTDIYSREVIFIGYDIGDCQQLEVDIAAPPLERCTENTYTINACNRGAGLVENAMLTVVLDSDQSYVNSIPSPTTIIEDTLFYFIDELDITTCQPIELEVTVSCNAVAGQAHCLQAFISPSDLCAPISTAWDESSIQLSGSCDQDSIRFILENIGIGDMSTPLNYRIIQDLNLFEQNEFSLTAGEQLEFSLPADGSTWRMEAEQSLNHPGSSMPAIALEGCGGNPDFSTGFLTMFPQDDGNIWYD
ncbi:MAG: hypothetical protein AAF598_06405, partial [Bacteroidota bacterium]